MQESEQEATNSAQSHIKPFKLATEVEGRVKFAVDQLIEEESPRYARQCVGPGGLGISQEILDHWGDIDDISAVSFGNPRETRGVPKDNVITRHSRASFLTRIYPKVKDLGSGAFGEVILVRDDQGNKRVSKTISTKDMKPDLLTMMRTEIELLAKLDHPHVVKLFEFAVDEKNEKFVLMMEYLSGGDCLDLLWSASRSVTGILREATVAKIAQGVLMALGYCHSQNILHRDIKPENMMLTSNSGQPDCKIIDFGLAVRRDHAMKDVCGTPAYIAPEVLAQLGYDSKVDIWSTGVSVLELLTGVKPFGCPEECGGQLKPVITAIRDFRNLKQIETRKLRGLPGWPRTMEAHGFVSQCMNVDPRQRPNAGTALGLPWLTRHKEALTGMTSEMIQSLVSYNEAPPIMRCCIYIVAARNGVPDLDQIGAAFKLIDVDGDGMITLEELANAVKNASNWWDPELDVHRIVESADLDHTGGLNFTQFVAACLYARYTKEGSLDQLMRHAFRAMDDNRDGMVNLDDIMTLFRERDAPVLRKLPQEFNVEQWLEVLGSLGGSSPGGRVVLPAFPSLDSLLDRLLAGTRTTSCKTPFSFGYPSANVE